MGFLEGRLESLMEEEEMEMSSSSGSGGSTASGDNQEGLGGDAVNMDTGESMVERRDSLMPRETGLIAEMEREVMEAGLGGGSMGIQRMSRRAGVGLTPMRWPVRIELEQLS